MAPLLSCASSGIGLVHPSPLARRRQQQACLVVATISPSFRQRGGNPSSGSSGGGGAGGHGHGYSHGHYLHHHQHHSGPSLSSSKHGSNLSISQMAPPFPPQTPAAAQQNGAQAPISSGSKSDNLYHFEARSMVQELQTALAETQLAASKATTEKANLIKKVEALEKELAVRQKALENAAEFARENIDLTAEREKAKYARIIAQQSIADAGVQIEKSHKKRDAAIRELEERVAEVMSETSVLQNKARQDQLAAQESARQAEEGAIKRILAAEEAARQREELAIRRANEVAMTAEKDANRRINAAETELQRLRNVLKNSQASTTAAETKSLEVVDRTEKEAAARIAAMAQSMAAQIEEAEKSALETVKKDRDRAAAALAAVRQEAVQQSIELQIGYEKQLALTKIAADRRVEEARKEAQAEIEHARQNADNATAAASSRVVEAQNQAAELVKRAEMEGAERALSINDAVMERLQRTEEALEQEKVLNQELTSALDEAQAVHASDLEEAIQALEVNAAEELEIFTSELESVRQSTTESLARMKKACEEERERATAICSEAEKMAKMESERALQIARTTVESELQDRIKAVEDLELQSKLDMIDLEASKAAISQAEKASQEAIDSLLREREIEIRAELETEVAEAEAKVSSMAAQIDSYKRYADALKRTAEKSDSTNEANGANGSSNFQGMVILSNDNNNCSGRLTKSFRRDELEMLFKNGKCNLRVAYDKKRNEPIHIWTEEELETPEDDLDTSIDVYE